MNLFDIAVAKKLAGGGGGGGGSSDFSTATVTINAAYGGTLIAPFIDESYSKGYMDIDEGTKTSQVAMYKGSALLMGMGLTMSVISGGAVIDENGFVNISGDCVLSAS